MNKVELKVEQCLDIISDLREQLATQSAEGSAKDAIIAEFTELIGESRGVDGLHLNGDLADWDWLMNNGWLEKYMDFATASKSKVTETMPVSSMTNADRISCPHGGLVPLQHFLWSWQLQRFDEMKHSFVVSCDGETYVDTRHPEFANWMWGFIDGAVEARDEKH